MKRMKIAIIGCGAVAEMFHLPTLQRMPEFEIKYLVDVSEDRIKQVKNKLKINCEVATDYKEILSDTEVEAVMILTPPKLHYQMVMDAAKAHKHIFCEKPFAMNAKEAEEMVRLCEESNVKIMAGFNFRFIPQFKKIKELVDKGFFGTLIGGHSTMFANAFAWPSVSKFQYSKGGGGGALFEMGTHHIDLMNWFFGDADGVIAKITMLTNDKIDDTASVYVQYKNGANCIVYTGWNRLGINTVTVIGLDGYATAFASKNEILYYRKDLVGQAPIRIKVKKGLSAYHEEMFHFYECIRKKKNLIMTGDEIVNSVRVVEKAYESNELGELVSLK